MTDDRGARYELDFTPGGDLGWPNLIGLSPAPPASSRWLDVAAPDRQAVRVDLRPGGPLGRSGATQVSVGDTKLSPGEHLLVMLAERLLTWTTRVPARRACRPRPRLRQTMAAGLGDIVGALEAADVLSPLSPVPGPARHAVRQPGPERARDHRAARARPAGTLAQRAGPLPAQETGPVPLLDGYAALTATLPELDGIRLTLLGLHHSEGGSSLHVLAQGQLPEPRPGPLDIDPTFPLSVWLRDSGGRWHAARRERCHRARPGERRSGCGWCRR